MSAILQYGLASVLSYSKIIMIVDPATDFNISFAYWHFPPIATSFVLIF